MEKVPLAPEQIEARLALLPPSLRPIKDAVLALASSGVWVEGGNGGPLLAGPRPDIGSQAYDIVLFEPLPVETLATYEKLYDFRLSDPLVELLRHLNGGVLFEINLYGVPPTMAANPPLLDRSRRAPLDIASGRYWRARYGSSDLTDTLIASRNVGDSGQVGYFMDPGGGIAGRGNGSPDAPAECGPWTNLTEWLAAEMA
ncbi:hypothetical protein [Brevundimonas sp. AAP58]|uniref:hypothetical protein n=1 Tax=Brevundimonas sp. AAP58 TaxID=1523422 RepID=UPI000A6A1C45|nr:hypothetical protein [Brevundimonas sp. AAP58]